MTGTDSTHSTRGPDVQQAWEDCRRDGAFVVVARNGSLHGLCVVCGGHALREDSRTVTWTPRPRPIFALAARWWFLWMMYALVRRRRTTIRVGYCARHRALRTACKVSALVLGTAMALLMSPYDGQVWSRGQVLASMIALVACTLPTGVLATEFHVDDVADDGSVRLAVDARVLKRVPPSAGQPAPQPVTSQAGGRPTP